MGIFATQAQGESLIDRTNSTERILESLESGESKTYEAIDILHNPQIENSQFTISLYDSSSLEVSNSTRVILNSTKYNRNSYQQGNYAFRVENNSRLTLSGDVDIFVSQKPEDPTVDVTTIGANGIWANDHSTVTIGNENSTSRIWVLATKPDSISAKTGSSVTLNSTHNMLVGSIETVGNPLNGYGTISGTFSGADSYWFGDEISWKNAEVLSSNLFGSIIYSIGLSGAKNDEHIDLTFENGAQWSYLNVNNVLSQSGNFHGLSYNLDIQSIAKRISAITLRNGGIINLFDEDIENKWKDIGLWEHLETPETIIHDYVRIGDLKGSGGIFRLDLDAEDKSNSDIVYIENSTDAGLHYIEPYNLDRLTSINPSNTLVFALVDKKAADAGVKFVDKINIEGETLFDYELELASDTILEEDLNREELANKLEDDSSYVDGTKWFIQRINMSRTAGVHAMTGVGFAAYDAAVEMDRRDRRLLQVQKDPSTGLWVRLRHGERGVEDQYSYQMNGATIGADVQLNDVSSLSLAFTYEEGDNDFETVDGNGEMSRYELAVYNTYDFGVPYIDLIGRLGTISSEYSAASTSGKVRTSGDFDQMYAAISAEVGYTFASQVGVFVEPQVQLQLTYLDGYDYKTDNDMTVDADNELAILSRVGVRAGKTIETPSVFGEIYGRADFYHQFTKGQDVIFRDNSSHLADRWGTNTSYGTIGIGSFMRFNDRWGLQFDVEKSFGGETIDSWLISGQAKYVF